MNPLAKLGKSKSLALLLAGVTLLVLWTLRAKLWFDPETYSAGFADKKTLLGIPNFGDVVTNLGFAILGLYGFRRLDRMPESYRGLATVFAMAIFGTALGSAYFHFAPAPLTLFWDQLPMSIGFASFVGMVVADRVSIPAGNRLGFALCILGPWSVWNIYYGSGETAYYLALQFGTLIYAILLLVFSKGGALQTKAVMGGLVAYILAKVFESHDAEIYERLGFISGHSLKHLAATVALAAILWGAQSRAVLEKSGRE